MNIEYAPSYIYMCTFKHRTNHSFQTIGGWDRETGALPSDLTTEIAQAFENVQETLVRAGGKGWSQVYSINGYFTVMDEEAIGLFVTELTKWCPDHQPILTGVQVQGLAFGMRVEIAVKAHLGEKE